MNDEFKFNNQAEALEYVQKHYREWLPHRESEELAALVCMKLQYELVKLGETARAVIVMKVITLMLESSSASMQLFGVHRSLIEKIRALRERQAKG